MRALLPPSAALILSPFVTDALQSAAPHADWTSQLFDDSVFPELSAPFSPFFPAHTTSAASSDILDPTSIYLPHGYTQSIPRFPSLSIPGNSTSTLSDKWWEDTNAFCQHKQML